MPVPTSPGDESRPQMEPNGETSKSRSAAKKHARGTQVLGGVSLTWLAAALLSVVYGGYLLADEESTNQNVLVAVALAGAGGAAMGSAVSLATFLARSQYRAAWTAYFFLRPILGSLIAVFVYIFVRGMYLSDAAKPDALNVYGVLGSSFLFGLFSRQILERMSLVASALFSKTPRLDSNRDPREDFRPVLNEVDRYQGHLTWSFAKNGPTSWELIVRSGSHEGQAERSVSLDFGEGPQPERVKLDLMILGHSARDVSPLRRSILAPSDKDSEPVKFLFHGVETEPSALIEVSQRGRTVRAIRVGSATDDS